MHKFVLMAPDLVKIYTEGKPPRLIYIAGVILGDILGLKWELVSDRRKLGKHCVINYSGENIKGSFKVSPDPLLFETGVRQRDISMTKWRSLPVFFQTTPDSDLPFDIFASSFYLLSRYEEYLEFKPDEYGRFRPAESLAYNHGFLDRPVIDLWTREFARSLLRKFQTLAFRRNQFRALMTIDADEPFAYLGKSLSDNITGFLQDISRKTGHISDRYGCLAGRSRDPYDTFSYIIEKIDHFGCEAGFFFPLGDPSRYDRNPVWKSPEYRNLICGIPPRYFKGIHPSFYSTEKPGLIADEIGRLRSIKKSEVTESRFHYLKMRLPESYRSLLRIGIAEEYSMGYHDEPGFRAGIARQFFFYDLLTDEQTRLRVTPFQIMDIALEGTFRTNPEDARSVVRKIMSEVVSVGGTFVSIWHNTSLLENDECKGWRDLFEFTLASQSHAAGVSRL